ncbi:MAG TPA: glycosyltransferase, partial [Rhizomicrobium sp.]|nr:glycosyltransferase [Rhizomicrobium sp.]
MKFLLVTLGSIGDLFPFLAVGEALRQRGHTVVIASNAGYGALVAMTGFEFAAIWERSQQSLDGIIAHDPVRAWAAVREEMFVPATGAARDFIAHHARSGPCTVLASWTAFGARLAHAELDVPLCTVYLSPGAVREDDDFKADGATYRNIGFFSDWFGDPPAGVEPAGFAMLDDALVPPLPAELENFLGRDAPPVVFTPGSFMRGADIFFRESLAACEALNLRAIFLTPYREQLPASLPASVLHFKYVSLQRLAPRSAALVHHGGIGTCAQGLRAGIPQLVTPVFFDQPDNAARLAALGVSDGISAGAYGKDEAAAKLQMLICSDLVKQNCSRIHARFDAQEPLRRIC